MIKYFLQVGGLEILFIDIKDKHRLNDIETSSLNVLKVCFATLALIKVLLEDFATVRWKFMAHVGQSSHKQRSHYTFSILIPRIIAFI